MWHDTAPLLSQHAELAAAEMSERTSGLAADAGLLVGSVIVRHAGALTVAAVSAAAFALHDAADFTATDARLFGLAIDQEIAKAHHVGALFEQRNLKLPSEIISAPGFARSTDWTEPRRARR